MLVVCGNCKKTIYDGFGILYKLERGENGELLYPDEKKDYIPANSAVCEDCWSKLPVDVKLCGEEEQKKIEQSTEEIFAYISSDSNVNPLSGSKEWSSLFTNENEPLVFIRMETVNKHLPGVIKIVNDMIVSRKIKS